jgi:5-methyltetrahydrofolate--homocysteine methyltransferase
MPPGACPEEWCLRNPEIIAEVHSGYASAGSDIIYTCTFGANEFKLGQYGISDVKGINRDLAIIARRAAEKEILVAGDIGPTGQFVEPFGSLGFERAIEIFREQAAGLLAGGVDLFVIETMMDIQEARAALIAVKELTDRFVMVTMTFEKDGRTLNGTDPLAALITLQSLGADAFGCNCSAGPAEMLPVILKLKPYARDPLIAKPNAGLPRLEEGRTLYEMDAGAFADFGRRFAADGVNMMGGCCGTGPEHIRALKQEISGMRPVPPARNSVAALSSPRAGLILEEGAPVAVVGERINPTGKKLLKEALEKDIQEGKYSLIREMAREQEKGGAKLLDVNVGLPGIDEPSTMRRVVSFLSSVTDLPLVIDSPDPATIEAALRIYPGRALINSISGERRKSRELLPIAAKYGAMFILLPLTEREVPETASVRARIAQRVMRRARKFGFTKEDVVVDGLALTVAAAGGSAMETLKMVDWCTRRFKARSILGISNVSFGLPERKWINAAFLAMAAEKGLSLAIANPSHEELMSLKMAADVLTHRDSKAGMYIGHFSSAAESRRKEPQVQLTPPEKVVRAILDGARSEITDLLGEAMACGIDAFQLVDEIMIPAITRVGELFEQRSFFLPQLIASAETMERGVRFLEPCLKREDSPAEVRTVLLATVEGDVHDIGKNIVALIMRNHGFKVIDLGKDVPSRKIVDEAKKIGPDMIGLSALMTTTMVRMKEVIELARSEGVSCGFLIGGAVVNASYADSIGAAYARDGVEAVKILKSR